MRTGSCVGMLPHLRAYARRGDGRRSPDLDPGPLRHVRAPARALKPPTDYTFPETTFFLKWGPQYDKATLSYQR